MIVNWVAQPTGEGWDVEPHAVVWVSVERLEASFVEGEQYVGFRGSGCGQRTRYDNIGRHITSGREIWMPHISLDETGVVVFTDGRHRFAWVRDHGAKAIAVTTEPSQAEGIIRALGTDLRVCEVTPVE